MGVLNRGHWWENGEIYWTSFIEDSGGSPLQRYNNKIKSKNRKEKSLNNVSEKPVSLIKNEFGNL